MRPTAHTSPAPVPRPLKATGTAETMATKEPTESARLATGRHNRRHDADAATRRQHQRGEHDYVPAYPRARSYLFLSRDAWAQLVFQSRHTGHYATDLPILIWVTAEVPGTTTITSLPEYKS